MLKESIEADIKKAMLAGDKELVSTLRTIKSVILDAEVATGARDTGLKDEDIVVLLIKESKKRTEASKIYSDAGDKERAQKETVETEIISKYLPEMIGEEEITQVAKEVIASMGDVSLQQMGQIIGQVKSKTGALADGSLIAKIVKDLVSK